MAELALNAGAPVATTGRRHRALLIAATLLAFCVVGLGAWVRLSDAGLGCPDWPGCYGHLVGVPDTAHEVTGAAHAFPGKPVHTGKAWKEMIHRYAAGTLGLLVLAIAVSAWRRQRRGDTRTALPENALLILIVLQAALGMWTVTLLLKPVIVTLHLLGGMATWATLIYLLHRHRHPAAPPLPVLGRLAVAVVFAQIALGGWVSSNYAALACAEFPACRHGELWPHMNSADFAHGFTLLRELGATASGDTLPFAALTAIHLTHRLGAVLVLLVVGAYGIRTWRSAPFSAQLILGALALQISFGIGNVLLHLPLPLAVAHNLGAATLLGVLVWGRASH